VIQSRFQPVLQAAIAAGAAIAFALLASQASHDTPPEFDLAVRQAIHATAAPWLTIVMKGATQAGGGWVLWPVGAAVAAMLARAGKGSRAGWLAITVIGANLVDEGMKLFFHRPRPEPWFGYPLPSTYSFPSGHAFVSFCFYVCLAAVVVREEWPPLAKAALWCAALGCTLTIGLSRVYLGVHYPSDVLAGYAAGIAWCTLVDVAYEVRRRALDRSRPLWP
jgi:undecaprenyl-diphosphatase